VISHSPGLPRSAGPTRPAFTLLELLLVLAVLATVAVISWPAVGGMLAKSELQDAARQVRTVWAKARLEAMESGAVRQFRFQPGTGCFEVTPLGRTRGAEGPADAEPWDTRGTARASLSHPLGDAGLDQGAQEPPGERLRATGVRFERPAVRPGDLLRVEPPEPLDASEANWSDPILFFPNGRASNATLRLHGRRNLLVQVALRGITGTVTIGKLERAEEQP
jgi:prepilin-type N-terminal cleavage/methylation domain-containing protein